jgi:hypothetical protein
LQLAECHDATTLFDTLVHSELDRAAAGIKKFWIRRDVVGKPCLSGELYEKLTDLTSRSSDFGAPIVRVYPVATGGGRSFLPSRRRGAWSRETRLLEVGRKLVRWEHGRLPGDVVPSGD